MSSWVRSGGCLVNPKQSNMIKAIEPIVATKYRKQQLIPSRYPALIRLTKAGNHPKFFLTKAAKGKPHWGDGSLFAMESHPNSREPHCGSQSGI